MKILLVTGDTLAPWAITFRAQEFSRRWINDQVEVVSSFEGNPNDYDVVHFLFSGYISKYRQMLCDHPDRLFTSIVSLNSMKFTFDSEDSFRSILQNSKKIVCLNKELQQLANDLMGSPFHHKTVYIPNGIDEKLFTRPFTVGFVGSNFNEEYKGLLLIKAACANLGVKLLLPEFHFPDTVILRDQMPAFYEKIDCLCIASLGEGSNNPTLEALAMNKPVISTRTGIAEELEGVILVDRTVESIMQGIRKVYTRAGILEKYTWDNIATQYHDLYTSTGPA